MAPDAKTPKRLWASRAGTNSRGDMGAIPRRGDMQHKLREDQNSSLQASAIEHARHTGPGKFQGERTGVQRHWPREETRMNSAEGEIAPAGDLATQGRLANPIGEIQFFSRSGILIQKSQALLH